jgi:hypothetical protein
LLGQIHDDHKRADREWRRFVMRFVFFLIGCLAVVYGFVLLVDPYDVVPFSLPLDRKIVSISQRYMYPQIVRSRRFDSLIVGTSTSRLLDPERLNKEFGVKFANLAFNSATAWEQNTMVDYFMRKVGAPKALIVGIDAVWCDPQADKNRITLHGFPEWLYDDNVWNDYLYLFNSGALEIAGRLLGYNLGLYHERVRYDGYQVFVPPEADYDLAHARRNIWGTRTPAVPPNLSPPLLSASERQALTFPALLWLNATLDRLPASTLKILALMPVHVAAQPWPGTHAAAFEAECKARIVDIAQRHGAKVIDWRIDSALTHEDSNYWDNLHYRVPVATRLADQLGEAVLHGRVTSDGWYRILVS